MKLTWLLRLYPRAWRRRYEDEFAALLEHHPTSPRLILDIILGAIDAHLWPQVSAAGRELAAKAAGGGRAMLSEEYQGTVRIDPSTVVAVALSLLMLAMVVAVGSIAILSGETCPLYLAP
jgi:hypothetical protein